MANSRKQVASVMWQQQQRLPHGWLTWWRLGKLAAIPCLGIAYKNKNTNNKNPKERVLTANAAGVESATCGFVQSWKSACCKPLWDEVFLLFLLHTCISTCFVYILRRHSLTTRWWTDHVWFMCYVYAVACHLLLHGICLLWKEVQICMMPHRSWATEVIWWLRHVLRCVAAAIQLRQSFGGNYIHTYAHTLLHFNNAAYCLCVCYCCHHQNLRPVAVQQQLGHTIYPSHSYFSWNLWLISHVRVTLLHGWYAIRFVAPLSCLSPQSIL